MTDNRELENSSTPIKKAKDIYKNKCYCEKVQSSLYAMSTSSQVSRDQPRAHYWRKHLYDVTIFSGLFSVFVTIRLELKCLCVVGIKILYEAATQSLQDAWRIQAGQEITMWRGLFLVLLSVSQMHDNAAFLNGKYSLLLNFTSLFSFNTHQNRVTTVKFCKQLYSRDFWTFRPKWRIFSTEMNSLTRSSSLVVNK